MKKNLKRLALLWLFPALFLPGVQAAAQSTGVISGVISAPDLPDGSIVAVFAYTDNSRGNPVAFSTFSVQQSGVNYTLTLPAPDTYYISAINSAPVSLIGNYNDYAPVYLAPDSAITNIDFSIALDTVPPSAAITSIVEGSTITSLYSISGTASDNIGVSFLETAVRDVTTDLWWSGQDNGIWLSTGVAPFDYVEADFQGKPSAVTWTIFTDTDVLSAFNRLSSLLATGHEYLIYLRGQDFTGNIQQTPTAVSFIWDGPQGDMLPNYVQELYGSASGISSITWHWDESPVVDGYAVSLDSGVFLSSVPTPSYTRVDLPANTQFSICVAAYNAYGTGPRNCVYQVYTLAAVPGVPDMLSVTDNAINLKWSPGGGTFGASYEILASTDNFQTIFSSNTMYDWSNEDVFWTIDNLDPDTEYYVKVRAINGNNIPTEYSAVVSTKTLATPLGQVQGFTVLALGVSSVSWSWQAVSNADGYGVYSDYGVFLSSVAEPLFIRTGIAPNTRAGIFVYAYNSYGTGLPAFSPEIYSLAEVPGTPALLSVTSDTISAEWGSAGNGIWTLYDLAASSDNFQTIFSSVSIHSWHPGYVSEVLTGLEADTVYSVKVRAVNGNDIPTEYSEVASIKTLAAPPGAPVNLTAVYEPAPGKVLLFWSSAAYGNPSASYKVYRAAEPYPVFVLSTSTLSTYYEDNSIQSATYYYRITALNSEGAEGPYSDVLKITVDATPPWQVTDLHASSAADGSAVLSWTAPVDNSGLAYYILKISDSYISYSYDNWDSAVFVATIPASMPVGGVENFIVTPGSTDTVRFYTLKAYDLSGNASYFSNSAVLDFVPPVLSVISPVEAGAIVSRPFSVQVNASDNYALKKAQFLADGVVISSVVVYSYYNSVFIWNTVGYSDGDHVFTVRVFDYSGNMSQWNLPVTVNYAPPSVPVITYPLPGFSQSSTQTYIAGTADPGVYVVIFVNDNFAAADQAGADGVFTASDVPLGGDGAVSITAQAVDSRDASPYSVAVTGVVDSGPPNAPVSVSAQPLAYGRVALAWLAPSGEIPASYNIYRSASELALSSGAVAPQALRAASGVTALEFTDAPGADGIYYYAAASVDAASNESVLSDIAYAVSDAQPPSAAISLPGETPPLGAGPHPVQVTVTEVLSETPYLTFTQSGAYPVQISLEPSSPYIWVGTLAVTQAMPSGTGNFSFQGVDLSGNAGHQITSGGALVLETEGPTADIAFAPVVGPYLKTGTYPVTLALTKPAALTPELWFTVTGGTQAVQLSSTTGSDWQGVIIVDTNTGEGAHYFSYQALDALGNTGTLIQGATYFIADTIAPGAPLSLNGSKGPGGLITFSWSPFSLGDKPAYYCVYMDGSRLTCGVVPKPEDGTGTFSYTPSDEASYEYYVTALDTAGNESAASNTVSVVSDSTPPEPPVIISTSANSSVNLGWSAGGAETPSSYRLYRTTYTAVSTGGLAYRALIGTEAVDTPNTDGVYYYALTALDVVGNESALSAAMRVSYSGAAPVITVTGVEIGAYYNSTVYPLVVIQDLNLSQSTVTLNSLLFASGSGINVEGAYTLAVSASDSGGHSSQKSVSFAIDKTSPAITLSGVADGGYYEAAVTPVISGSDAHFSTVTALLNGLTYISGLTIAENGAYNLEITASDLAGNVSHSYAAFTIDQPPLKPGSLTAVIEDGSTLALSWAPYPGAVVYKVYKDSVYLSPVSATASSYRDTAYAGGIAHVYEVLAVDSRGREGARARAEIPALSFALAGYGNLLSAPSPQSPAPNPGFASEALNRGFFDTVRFRVTNNSSQSVQAGPVNLTIGSQAPVSGQAVVVAAGTAVEIAPVVFTSTASVDSVSGKAVLTMPQAGDAAFSMARTFSMAVRDLAAPVVEVSAEALVRGAYSKVNVKFNNRGSAPVDIVTARGAGLGVRGSPAVAVELKTQAGFTLSRAELLQTNANILNTGGDTAYFIRVPAGGNYTFEPLRLAVPEIGDSLTVIGTVNGFAWSLDYNPQYSSLSALASKTMSTELAVPYKATIYTEQPIYDQGSTVTIKGQVKDVWENILSSFPVSVSITNNGYARTISSMTDGNGEYSVNFIPTADEAGIYDVSVRHPEIVGEAASSSFSITGFAFNYTDYTLTIAQGSSYAFEVILKNTGGTALEGLLFPVENVSGSGVSLTPGQPAQSLQPGTQMKLTVTCVTSGSASSLVKLILKARDSNGFERSIPITVNVVPSQVIPKLTPPTFEIGMLAGDSKIQRITVENIGFSTWTNVNVNLPTLDWVTVDGMTGLIKSLGDIPPGGNVSFTLRINPPAGLLNRTYAQNPLVELISDNFETVPVNVGIAVTSSKKSNIYFNVTNADKFPTDSTRFVGGANITLTSLDIYSLTLTAKTDANGFAPFRDVPSGNYAYRVESAGAQPASGTLELEPGLDKTMDILMPTSMVTYKWSVTPTTITDKYDLTLDMTFRTDVPAPAIVISPPLMSIAMEGGQTLYTQYTVENKGLVSAFNFQLEPQNTDAVKIELPFTTISEIKPGQVIVVPVKITLAHASCEGATIAHKCQTHCAAGKLINVLVESWQALFGTTCPAGSTGGGAGGGGGPLTFAAWGAGYISRVGAVAANMGCGGGCIEGTTIGCSPCQSCQGGTCKFNGSNSSGCKSDNICKKAVCVQENDGTGRCDTTGDNSAETNAKVASGEISILSCLNRKSNGNLIPPNGCGTLAHPLNPTPVKCASEIDFTGDCNEHDKLYAVCNTDKNAKDFADEDLRNRMQVRCNPIANNDCYNQCLGTTKGWYWYLKYTGYLPGSIKLPTSSSAYDDAQKDACTCCSEQ